MVRYYRNSARTPQFAYYHIKLSMLYKLSISRYFLFLHLTITRTAFSLLYETNLVLQHAMQQTYVQMDTAVSVAITIRGTL